MSTSNTITNTWFEQYFEDRLAQIEPGLIRRANYRMSRASEMDRDDAVQLVRIALWEQFSETPEEWAAKPLDNWRAYAHGCLKYAMIQVLRERKAHRETQASDLVTMCRTEDEVTTDDALSMVAERRHAKHDHRQRDHQMQLADLRIDLERAIERGMEKLYNDAQRRDMALLIDDIQAGYTLTESIKRHHWTRNRGVTMMRKLRTVMYEALTGEQKTKGSYLGSHHPLTGDEITRIKELHATGLGCRKIAKLVGRSHGAVEGICKTYPQELVQEVHHLRQEGLSYRDIGERVGKSKSYIGQLLQATHHEPQASEQTNDPLIDFITEALGGVLVETAGWLRFRDGNEPAFVPAL
jgi:RNA polymerase sigma factor (sigma-70 family)